MDIDTLAQVIGQFLEVLAIGVGQDQFHDAGAAGRDDFLADTAHSQHLTGQGQLAGHTQLAVDALPARQRQQRRGHGDARAGTVLGRCALRHVQVHQRGIEVVPGTAVVLEMRHHVAVGDLRGLFHHVTQFAGELEAAVQGVHLGAFHRQGGAAHGGPGQPGGDAEAADRLFSGEGRLAQQGLDVLLGDPQLVLVALQQRDDALAHDAR